jgi:iron(III) transport system ATP-binding protein
VTTVFVTHDQHEALSMSDRIVVMKGGVVHQIGTPEDIYRQPSDLFVADFIGTVNLLDGTVAGTDGGAMAVRLDGSDTTLRVSSDRALPRRVKLAIRPEAVKIHDTAPADVHNVITADVVDRMFLGDHYRYWVQVGSATVVVQTERGTDAGRLILEIPHTAIRIFDRDDTGGGSSDDGTHDAGDESNGADEFRLVPERNGSDAD